MRGWGGAVSIGLSIRGERRIRGWTLDDLSERAGVSKSLLSKIERDQVSPSLRTLKALADALDVPLAWLLQEDHLEQFIVRRDRRQGFVVPGSEIRREVIAPALLRQLTMLIAYFAPGQSSSHRPDMHHGEECLHVLQGQLTATVGGQTTVLAEGDTLYFDARTPHDFRNDGETETQVLVALLYPPAPPRPSPDSRGAKAAPARPSTAEADGVATDGRRPGLIGAGAKPNARRKVR
jgi:transcriptional regulator with XRE-family HTH domain